MTVRSPRRWRPSLPREPGAAGAYLRLLGASLAWGGGAIAVKYAVLALPPVAMAFARYLIAVAILAALLALTRRRWPRRDDLPLLFLLGLTGVFGFAVPFNAGLQFTGAGEGSVLTAISPFVSFLFAAWLLGDRLTARRLVAGGISLGGVAVLVSGGPPATAISPNRVLGDLLVLIAAVNWGVYSVLVRLIQQRGVELLAMTTWSMIIGVALMALALPFEPRPIVWQALGPDVLAAVLYAGLVSSVLAYLWWNESVRRIGPARASLFTNLNPVVAVVIAAVLFGEWFTPLQAAGAALVIAGLVIANLPSRQRPAPPHDAASSATVTCRSSA
ncbi:MAG: DMT family transporter [Chloroflexota bacterium]|nr:DMT family transporter [Dehalococcoidia bacterium]MDW8252441.1 DMT family transporter [Chloroflexota bacterium]